MSELVTRKALPERNGGDARRRSKTDRHNRVACSQSLLPPCASHPPLKLDDPALQTLCGFEPMVGLAQLESSQI